MPQQFHTQHIKHYILLLYERATVNLRANYYTIIRLREVYCKQRCLKYTQYLLLGYFSVGLVQQYTQQPT